MHIQNASRKKKETNKYEMPVRMMLLVCDMKDGEWTWDDCSCPEERGQILIAAVDGRLMLGVHGQRALMCQNFEEEEVTELAD